MKTSSIILLAKTNQEHRYLFGAYLDTGEATRFLTLPEDHKMFTDTLRGKQTIMGFKTLEATPLDFPDVGRFCITHHPEKVQSPAIPVSSIEEGIKTAKERAVSGGQDTVYIIGGASILKQCVELDLLDEVILTLTESHLNDVPNPVFLDFYIDDWKIEKDTGLMISENSDPLNLAYRYLTLSKK